MREPHSQRKPGSPLPSEKHEHYAQLRAGGESARSAQELSGVARNYYLTLEKSQDFRDRVRELRNPDAVPPTITLDWLAAELAKNVTGARAAEQFKASTEALKQLADLYATHRDHFDGLGHEKPAATGTAAEQRASLRSRLTVLATPKASEGA